MAPPSTSRLNRTLAALAWCAFAASHAMAAQPQLAAPAAWGQGVSLGNLRMLPSLQAAPGGFWGPAASIETSSGWFASASTARLNAGTDPRPYYGLSSARTLSAGFRFSPGSSVSLAVTSASGVDLAGARVQRLGLSVRYDWPTYYVRLGLDPRLGATPQDTLRLSAGFSF